ncbi:MAG: phage portal protein [Alcaligenaceae bacterium]|nr:phage portal protein [Alcaligenaceae bacterium SAGV5]MPS51256.1 phage portal protein [Alcaligenaceae bacterium SAGV3]MPT57247.1 phage portal protein [Alcaligenaceae bacterium]
MAKDQKKRSAKSSGKARAEGKKPPEATYEAAEPSKQRKFRRDRVAPDQLVQRGALAIRDQMRYLERNHDIARGIIRTMVNNVIGPNGIGIEPQPRRRDGTIHEEYANVLRSMLRQWARFPEVTHRHHFSKSQRLMAQAWFRDGEAWTQLLIGRVPNLTFRTPLPFALELFEADMVPMDYDDPSLNIRQGIQRNAWGQITGVYVYKTFPGDNNFLVRGTEAKRIPGDRILQLADLDRIGQLRGVSGMASIINRLEDVKDLEESERIAAKLAARLTAYVRKGDPQLYNPESVQTDDRGQPIQRDIAFDPGTIIDGLGAGEEIGLIDTKRPNPNIYTWRQGQLRAAAAGAGVSYSSAARDYDGTYSGQRQELVEQWVNYAVLTDEFVGQWLQPVWEAFVNTCDLSGVAPMPKDVDRALAHDCLFVGQSMPWIDPMKEAQAWQMLVQCGFASEVEVMRKRGVNPLDVLDQLVSWRTKAREKNLVLTSDAWHTKVGQLAAGIPSPAADDDDEDDDGATKADRRSMRARWSARAAYRASRRAARNHG